MSRSKALSNEEVISLLSQSNTQTYNYLKCIEELTELQEVLIKKINKQGGVKEPTQQALVEELGDVMIRVSVIMEMLQISTDVSERVDFKCKKFGSYLQDGLYAGKI